MGVELPLKFSRVVFVKVAKNGLNITAVLVTMRKFELKKNLSENDDLIIRCFDWLTFQFNIFAYFVEFLMLFPLFYLKVSIVMVCIWDENS